MKLRALWISALVVATTAALVHADGPNLQTLEMGTGPTIVFVPGLGGTRTDWLPTVKKLRDRYHCVMVEIPGQGSSPLPDPFSLQAASLSLDALLATQKAESTIVVGSGLGGMLALGAAAAHPEHVRGVFLIDTRLKSPFPIPDQQRDQIIKFMDENYEQFSQMAFSKMGRDSIENVRLYALMAAVPPATVKAYFRQIFGADSNNDVKGLKVPLAAVFTERQWKEGASAGATLKAFGYDDTTAVAPRRIANAGMLVMKEQPDTLATMVAGFATQSFATPRRK